MKDVKCYSCGAEVREQDRFCAYCGREQPNMSTVETRATEIHIHHHYEKKSQPEKSQIVERVVEHIVDRPAQSPKSRTVMLVLLLVLGLFGAHKFYSGRPFMGILYILTHGLFGLGLIVDFISILFGTPRDGKGLPIRW